jgi:YidC/Oxa1 family membrane protein insertase
MASRTWLAVALMLFIWFGWLRWFAPVPTEQPNKTAVTSTARSSDTSPISSPQGKGSSIENTQISSGFVSEFSPIAQVATKEFNSPLLNVVFSAIGGKLMSVKLPKYHETIDDKSPLITLVSPEMSSLTAAALFSDKELNEFSRGLFETKHEGNLFSFSKKTKDAVFIKEYLLSPESNFIEANFKISFLQDKKREWGNLLIPIGTNDVEPFDAQIPLKSWEVVYYQNDEIKRITLDKVRSENEAVHQGHTEWLGFGNRYFSSVVINQTQQINPDVVVKKTENFNGAYLRYPIILKEGQKEIQFSFKFYLGPKNYKELSKTPGLKKLIDYGTFAVFAYPLLELLRFFYKFIHNYGVAIILLTLLVRALFYPLTQKSMKSMKAMQKLQPKIAALKEKYKDDQKKLNEEQMALFKAHKVNPAGGCLPMLIQLPVFIALYAVLGNSIELFHAPFFGWIHDLSTKDPFYIYPVLMGIAMFLQQKMTPSAGMDPMQQKMMYFMPVIFTFMMINLPSGLTLYIFVSTILGVIQQVSMKDKQGVVPQPS